MHWKRRQKIKRKIWKAFVKTTSTFLLIIVFISSQAQLFNAFEAHVINVTATISDRVCPGQVTLDFDKDAAGFEIKKGQIIDSEYSAWGIEVRAHNYNESHPQISIAFDSSNPSGGINGDKIIDIDLGTPNKMYGGPGDSESGDGFEPSNDNAMKNLLIIPDNAVDENPADGYIDDPNDEPSGGSIRFIFEKSYAFSSVKYIDLDWSGGEVVGYSDEAASVQAFFIPISKGKGNSVQAAEGDGKTPIRFLKIRGRDSYAIDEVRLCPIPDEPATSCGDGLVQNPNSSGKKELCDDGNTENGDGCEIDCQPTTFCGDGAIQNPNSYGQAEACDDGALNGSQNSICTNRCTLKAGQCDARSPGYFKNNDGCQNGSGSGNWADEISALSQNYSNIFANLTGEEFCQNIEISNCPNGSTPEARRCRAKAHLLGDEANIAKGALRPDALLAGADDGDIAFDILNLSSTSTVSQAMQSIENILSNDGAAEDLLNRAQYAAQRVYSWYENENSQKPECVLPGMGNGILEKNESCDDGNLIPWDGCSPKGEQEIVLNEILPDPMGDDSALMPNGEWVELFNLSSRPISIEGWMLYDAYDSHELPISVLNSSLSNTIIPAKNFIVIYRNGDSDFSLNNDKDSVRLYNNDLKAGGRLIDSFEWTTRKPQGQSFARIPDGNGHWIDPCPTPGNPNITAACETEFKENLEQNETPETAVTQTEIIPLVYVPGGVGNVIENINEPLDQENISENLAEITEDLATSTSKEINNSTTTPVITEDQNSEIELIEPESEKISDTAATSTETAEPSNEAALNYAENIIIEPAVAGPTGESEVILDQASLPLPEPIGEKENSNPDSGAKPQSEPVILPKDENSADEVIQPVNQTE